MPAVSILVATWNCGRYLQTAIDSLLAQTFGDFELIIIDDASTDDTPEILRQLARADARIRWERNEVNRRLGPALNRGLRACRARLVARADADDIHQPRRIEKQLAFLRANPHVGVLSAVEEIMDENEHFLRYKPTLTEDAEIRFFHMFTHAMSHTAVIYRKELVERVGGYDESFATGPEDYDLYARLLQITRFANLPDPLVRYRIRAGSDEQAPFPWRQRMKHEVAARQLSWFLGRPVAHNEAGALWGLYHGYSRLSQSSVTMAVGLVEELRLRISAQGQPKVLARFDRAIGDALVRQAAFHTYANGGLSRQLFWMALRLCPARIGVLRALFQAMRWCAPQAVRDLLRPFYRKRLNRIT